MIERKRTRHDRIRGGIRRIMDPKVLSKEVWERTVIRFGRERERIGRQGNRVGPT